MSNNISASQKENIDFIRQLGEAPDGEIISNALDEAAGFLIGKIEEKIKYYKLVNTGDLSTKMKLEEQGPNTRLILMPYYHKFMNKGVKGAKSKQPSDSPYSFKDSFSMSPAGRKSIKSLIDNGKATVRIVQRSREVGQEKKRRSVADMKLDTLIYAIKSGGIKKRPFLDEALAENREEVAAIVSKAWAEETIISLKPR